MTTCSVCQGTRIVTIPAHESKYMNRVYTVSEKKEACPSCSVAKVRAVRKHCATNMSTISSIPLEYRKSDYSGEYVISVKEGNVTGHESCYADYRFVTSAKLHGWNACAGTPGRWDSLFIPPDEMRNALAKFGL